MTSATTTPLNGALSPEVAAEIAAMVNAPVRLRPRTLSPWVVCTLPGWEGLRLRYIVSRSKGEIDALDNDLQEQAACFVADVAGWDWTEADGTPIPAPRGGEAASWAVCGVDLLIWICRDGWQTAVKASIPN